MKTGGMLQYKARPNKIFYFPFMIDVRQNSLLRIIITTIYSVITPEKYVKVMRAML